VEHPRNNSWIIPTIVYTSKNLLLDLQIKNKHVILPIYEYNMDHKNCSGMFQCIDVGHIWSSLRNQLKMGKAAVMIIWYVLEATLCDKVCP